MSRVLKAILLLNLIVLSLLVFVYPNLMVGPGKLIPGHKQLEGDCFACHTALRGVNPAKCVGCHKPVEIGLRTTLGLPVIKPRTSSPFHQQLMSENCVACHSDHAGVKRYAVQGRFNHGLLKQETRDQCQSCHKPPVDALHRQIAGNCVQCHTQERWTPATFDHGKFFVLDGDHNARCVSCHLRNEYARYTCYGCHEHTPDNIRRKHIEEGISKFDNCVECHRSSKQHDNQGGSDGAKNRGQRENDD
jgi:hypothetical protein